MSFQTAKCHLLKPKNFVCEEQGIAELKPNEQEFWENEKGKNFKAKEVTFSTSLDKYDRDATNGKVVKKNVKDPLDLN